MKKLFFLTVMALLLGAFALPAAAVPVTDLTALAGYFPEGSVAYASVRTDDDFVGTLDGLLQRVSEIGGLSLTSSLDTVASGIKTGATFQDLFRPWLGDTAAFGLLPLTTMDEFRNPVALIAISLTDREAAEAFFQSVTRPRDYVQTQGDGFTTYESTRDNTHLAFRDDVLLIASSFAAIAEGGAVSASLSVAEPFTTAIGQLPGADYNAVIYIDSPSILNFTQSQLENVGPSEIAILQALDDISPQVFGFTIVDGNSLTIDAVTAATGAALNVTGGMTTPLDLGIVSRLPAGTPLVILGTNFADSYSATLAQLEPLLAMQGSDVDMAQFETGLWLIELFVRGLTGLDLQRELLPALNGTYAIYAGVNPAAEGADTAFDLVSPELLLDFALTFSVTDTATAAQLRDNLNTILGDLPTERIDNLDIAFEDNNGTPVIVFSMETDPFSGDHIELLLAVTDEVFTVGTRRYVEAALNPGVGLDQDPHWQAAAQYFVADSYSLLYQSSANLAPLVGIFARTGSSDARDISQVLGLVTGLVDNSSISYGRLGETGVQMRAVLTLAGE